MRSLKNALILTTLLLISVSLSGCLSAWSYHSSAEELRKNRIYASGDSNAIRALDMGVSPSVAIKAVQLDGGAGIGIDVTHWEALKANPLRQTAAALGDAVMLYVGYRVVDNMNSSGGSHKSGNYVTVTGDGNVVHNTQGDNNEGTSAGNQSSSGGDTNFSPPTTTTTTN